MAHKLTQVMQVKGHMQTNSAACFTFCELIYGNDLIYVLFSHLISVIVQQSFQQHIVKISNL